MPLTTEQSQALMRIYNARQDKNQSIQKKRYEEVISLIPEYKETDEEITQNALRLATKGIKEEIEPAAVRKLLENANRPLMEKKDRLLREHGFPLDYLLPIYDCPDCKDRGFIENGDGLPEKCHCYRELALGLAFESIQKAGIPEEACFDNFVYGYYSDDEIDETSQKTPRENIEEVTAYFKNYLKSYPHIFANHLIYGDVGVGKTYIAYCIINELKKGAFPWVYLTAYEFFELAKQSAFLSPSLQKETAGRQFDEALNADMLVLDDLGSELPNSFTISQLFLCINERQLKNKPTIITTNLAFSDLKQNYGERVFSRLLDYNTFRISGDDIRYKKQIAGL